MDKYIADLEARIATLHLHLLCISAAVVWLAWTR